MAGMKQFFTRRNAPIWLPAIVFVRDFLAWQYIFSFEPGITEQAVFRGKLFMLPGSLIVDGFLPMLVNLAVGASIGLILRWSARKSLVS